jgi:diadenylate cyclase
VAVVLLVASFYEVARWARLEIVEWLMAAMAPYAAIALIVLYQAEIRRTLARLGRNLTLGRFFGSPSGAVFDDVVLAAEYLSANRIGALIVFEREVGLHTYIESGIPLDAHLSYDLLLAIFRPGSPLHDGAVIIQGTRIAGAACFLPLALNPGVSSQVGTRHRAAMGVTEESDAVVVLVSEQTGAISLAVGGALEFGLTVGQLTERLAALFRRFRATHDLASPSPEARVTDRVD